MLVKEGETVATGTPIAVIDEVGAGARGTAAAAAPRSGPPTPNRPPAASGVVDQRHASRASAVERRRTDEALRAALARRAAAGARTSRRHSHDLRAAARTAASPPTTCSPPRAWVRPHAVSHRADADTGAPRRRRRAQRTVDLRAADSGNDRSAHPGAAHHRRAHGREQAHRAARLVDGRRSTSPTCGSGARERKIASSARPATS